VPFFVQLLGISNLTLRIILTQPAPIIQPTPIVLTLCNLRLEITDVENILQKNRWDQVELKKMLLSILSLHRFEEIELQCIASN
jgi:hypothetical protein